MLRQMLSQSFFEQLVTEAIENTKTALVRAPLGDSHNHAFLKGQHEGLSKSLDLYRKAMRTDTEENA